MAIAPFHIERYYGLHELTTPHNLSASDCETLSVAELLDLSGTPLSDLASLRLGYTESQGHPLLREGIAALYEQAKADDVVVTNAPEEGIFVLVETLLEPGDRVVVQAPCYQSLRQLALHKGCDVHSWDVIETPDGWRLDLDRLEALLTPGTRLLIVNFPHNPTGIQADPDDWRTILRMASERGIRVFSDEMYRGVERDDADRLPSACDLLENAVSLWGLSKSFGLPGLRIGWLVTRDAELRAALVGTKDYTSICSNAAGELLATSAAKVAGRLFDRSRGIIRANLAIAEPFMTRHPDLFCWRRPQAGPVAFVRLEKGSAREFADRARRGCGVLLVPSPLFDFGDSHLRFGLGRADFEEGLSALEGFLGSGS